MSTSPPRSRTRSRGLAAIAGSALVLTLSACVFAGSPPNASVGDAINKAIKANQTGSSSQVDFGSVIKGKWTHMIVVCGGTDDDVDKALGFKWRRGVSTASKAFLSEVVFATGDSVESYFATGQDDAYVDHWFFTVCATPGDPDYGSVDNVVLAVPRSDANVEFKLTSGQAEYWSVSPEELLRLEANHS